MYKQTIKKEEVVEEIKNLVLEALNRLEAEDSQFIQKLSPYSKEKQISKLKSKKIKVLLKRELE
jgi:hypothetical protein